MSEEEVLVTLLSAESTSRGSEVRVCVSVCECVNMLYLLIETELVTLTTNRIAFLASIQSGCGCDPVSQ